jgi:capsule polysaccharide modification protein KpsS
MDDRRAHLVLIPSKGLAAAVLINGEANMIASDMSYSLPSYIDLKRAGLEKE